MTSMGARRVDCRAAGREVVSWLSADQSSTPKDINESFLYKCNVLYFMELSITSRFINENNGLRLMDWSEVESGEQGSIYVRGGWVKWPSTVVILGKSVRSWEKTTDLNGLRHITWDLKKMLHSSKLDGIIISKVDSTCFKFMINNSWPIVISIHQKRFATVCQSSNRLQLMIDSSPQSGSMTRVVDLILDCISPARKTSPVIQFVDAVNGFASSEWFSMCCGNFIRWITMFQIGFTLI